MAAPLFTPAKGNGSQVSSGGTVYQFNQGNWTPVASGGGTRPAPTPPPVPKSKGGSSSANMNTQALMSSPTPSFYAGNVPSGPSADEMAQIEDAYNAGMGYLANIENRLRPEYQSALEEAQSIYNTQASALGGQKQQAQTQLQEQQLKGQQSYESALAQARQMYDQLQRGYQQRFGGASSAGQAATEIANVERMRQQGQNYRTMQDVTRQVQAGLQSVDQQYNQNLLQLEQNKIAAQNQARRDFNDKLSQIDAQRGQLAQNKAAQKLAALQNLRQQVLQIEAENRNFQNTLALQREQAKLAVQTYAAQTAKTGTTTSDALTELQKLFGGQPSQPLVPTQNTIAPSPSPTIQGYARSLPQDQFYKSFSLPQITGQTQYTA